MTTQQDREKLIAFVKANACGGSHFNLQMERVAALLAEDGKAGGEVVAWGMRANGEGKILDCVSPEQKERGAPQYCIPLYTRPQPAQVAQPLTDEQWQEIADITGSIITRRDKDAIEKVLGIGKDQP